MTPFEGAPSTGSTAAEILGEVPIMRGWGLNDDVMPWSTVGTGLFLARVAGLQDKVKTGDLEDEWEQWSKLLSSDFVEYVRSEEFDLFTCGSCGAGI